MDEELIRAYVGATFADVDVARPDSGEGPEIARDDTFFFYGPAGNLEATHKLPFATIVTKDYPGFDEASELNRPGVFRLNVGVTRRTYRSLFGSYPGHLESGERDSGAADYNFAALDQLLPHPVYGSQFWVSILNPSESTFRDSVQALLAEAYQMAVDRWSKRTAS